MEVKRKYTFIVLTLRGIRDNIWQEVQCEDDSKGCTKERSPLKLYVIFDGEENLKVNST